jgi:hypothetical protein
MNIPLLDFVSTATMVFPQLSLANLTIEKCMPLPRKNSTWLIVAFRDDCVIAPGSPAKRRLEKIRPTSSWPTIQVERTKSGFSTPQNVQFESDCGGLILHGHRSLIDDKDLDRRMYSRMRQFTVSETVVECWSGPDVAVTVTVEVTG